MPFFLKDYQRQTVEAMDRFFDTLTTEKEKADKIPADVRKEYGDINFPERTWHTLFPESDSNHSYQIKKTGHERHCPNFCLRLPTGGGKTLMATYAIELFLKHVRRKKSGFVLWVVPSEQIFSQTIEALKNRRHPYREKLDDITGGKVKIITKKDKFSPQDTEEGLVILIMMLQSFSRDKLKKDDLKFFQDDGRFPEFFPAETAQKDLKHLVDTYKLDTEQAFDGLLPGSVRTSLGNVVKLLEPFIVLDEGHKAKSELATTALSECNPSCVCELTATPTEEANVLFSVAGRELEKEGMIKLDLNLIEEEVSDWKRLLDFSAKHLEGLQKEADKYKAQTGIYIRPINLIQVEATGNDQRDGQKIHAEDVKEYLLSSGISEDQIAIKTSSKNDIEGENLLSNASRRRFIITKQALQEGWDCSFAYSLTCLGSSRSQTALTQLVGRVLRQPYARKTGNKHLDESYVFCLRDSSKSLVGTIKKGFELDGMGDLFDRVKSSKSSFEDLGEKLKQKVRTPEFEKSLSDFFLPIFVTRNSSGEVREIDFSYDILPSVEYKNVSLSALEKVHIDPAKKAQQTVTAIGFRQTLAVDHEEFLEMRRHREEVISPNELKKSFFVRNILDLVPNPWVGAEIVSKALQILKNRFSDEEIAENQIHFLDELRKILEGTMETEGEINRLAREVFKKKIEKDEVRFVLKMNANILHKEFYFQKQAQEPYQRSLFEPIVSGSMNEFEKEFAYFLEERKERTYWWYRNEPRKGYGLVGWRKGRFYPDFIFTFSSKKPDTFQKIMVVETKGSHLSATQDTQYKRELVGVYNEFFNQLKDAWKVQTEGFPKTPKRVQFELVTEENWKSEMNRAFV